MPADENKNDTVTIAVESSKEKNSERDDQKTKKDKDKKHADELSEDDLALKEGLELAVTRLKEPEVALHKQALEHLRHEIKSATSSMTSVPKPLKFLRPHYDTLKGIYESWHAAHDLKQTLADVMSVLAMTMAAEGSQDCLYFKLQGSSVDISSWGHEYVRSLSGQIAEEYNRRVVEELTADPSATEDLMTLVDDIVPFQMQHNAEAEAVDLLMEVQQLARLKDSGAVDERNHERVCLYLLRSADFIADPEDVQEILDTAYFLYKSFGKYTDALRVALKQKDDSKIEDLFSEGEGEGYPSDLVKKQMGFILGRHRSNFESADEDLNEIIGNGRLSEFFVSVGKALDVEEPKTPEDIFKSHLAEGGLSRTRLSAAPVDSARANLASSFVNGFVNAGFGADKLMTTDGSGWIYRNKDHGIISATASLGMVLLWNVDEGLSQIDRYYHNTDDNVRAGACLAIGIVSSGVRNEADPALALLGDYLSSPSVLVRRAALSGLGMAYAGSQRQELADMLTPIVANTEGLVDMAEVSFAALALGMIFSGSCDDEVCSVLLQRLMESSNEELDHTCARYLCLSIGLLFLGCEDRCDPAVEAVQTVEHKISQYAIVTIETCAYAGTGNVLKVQQMLHRCAEHHDPVAPVEAVVSTGGGTAGRRPGAPGVAAPAPAPELRDTIDHQSVATLGIALITAGEEIGTEMSLRMYDHLLQYGGVAVRRVVPLAYGLLYVSHPEYAVVDQLSRLSHDQDVDVAMSAVFGLGLVSAGTNNSRIAGLLRQLSEFYHKETETLLFVVRIAQGLNSLGKGLLHLNPFHSDR